MLAWTRVIRMTMAAAVFGAGANASAQGSQGSQGSQGPAESAHPYGGALLRVQDKVPDRGAEPREAKKPLTPLNTIADVFAALEACWIPPAARAGAGRHADYRAGQLQAQRRYSGQAAHYL